MRAGRQANALGEQFLREVSKFSSKLTNQVSFKMSKRSLFALGSQELTNNSFDSKISQILSMNEEGTIYLSINYILNRAAESKSRLELESVGVDHLAWSRSRSWSR